MVHGLATDDFKPRLPPPHPHWQQEQANVIQYMLQMAGKYPDWTSVNYKRIRVAWQGSYQAPSWALVAHDIASGQYHIIEAKRLPSGCPSFLNPSDWSQDETQVMSEHFHSHQARIDVGDESAKETCFQWREILDEFGKVINTIESYMATMDPRHTLKYPDAAAFYVWSLQSPSWSSRTLFTPASLLQLEGLGPYGAGLAALALQIQQYQIIGVSKVRPSRRL